MAYFNLFASVTISDLDKLTKDPTSVIRPSLISGASHLLAYWVELQPLGELLARAIDGGEVIHSSLQHQLRVPLALRPDTVRELTVQLDGAISAGALEHDEWIAMEVNRMMKVFHHASAAGECVISYLEGSTFSLKMKR